MFVPDPELVAPPRARLALVQPGSQRAQLLSSALDDSYDVVAVTDIEGAIDILLANPPEIVLADLAGWSAGLDFLRALLLHVCQQKCAQTSQLGLVLRLGDNIDALIGIGS